MNIYRVTAEQSKEIETLVMANSKEEAQCLTRKAINTGEIGFDDGLNNYEHEIAYCSLVETDPGISKEIKDYGILTNEGELVYDLEIIEQIEKMNTEKEKEEWLKKTHLEFNFASNTNH